MSLLKKKTTYPDTISWTWHDFEREIIRGNTSVIEVYSKANGEYLGSVSGDDVRANYTQTFTRRNSYGYSRRIIVAKFNRINT